MGILLKRKPPAKKRLTTRRFCDSGDGELPDAVDLILDDENALVYAPDLMFLSTEHLDQYRDEFVYGPVDLAVEILSPSERPFLQNRKFTELRALRHPVVLDHRSARRRADTGGASAGEQPLRVPHGGRGRRMVRTGPFPRPGFSLAAIARR